MMMLALASCASAAVGATGGAAGSAAGSAGGATPADARPTVVLVLADAMGWGQHGEDQHPVLQPQPLAEIDAAGLTVYCISPG